ncbi:hypothetical protein QNZ52_004629 [Vibrio parahaemolyticus]|nr:hypothetical protein [Vibrio parahaemolyticus]
MTVSFGFDCISPEKRQVLGRRLAVSNGHSLWSDDDILHLKSLYSQGYSSRAISEIMGRSYNSVRTKLSRLCVTRYHQYSISEDAYIKRYYGLKPLSEIASRLGVSVSSLVDRATKGLGLKGRYCGENSFNCKLTDDDVEFIRQLSEHGLSNVDIAEKFDVSPGYVSRIIDFRARLDLSFRLN